MTAADTAFSGTVGIAGCGTMGLPMAECLLSAGIDVWGHDVRNLDEFGAFAPRMIEDAGAFAAKCDIVFSVVRDTDQTDALCFGDQGILRRDGRPDMFVTCSTLSPRYVADLAGRIPAGIAFADAPMSGAPYRAAKGTLTFMAGGTDGDINRLMPLFRIMGDTIHHLGDVGSGMTCKVLNNFVGVIGVVAVRKALASAATLGLDRRRLLDVMRLSSGSTWFGDNIDAIDWSRQGYDPGNTIGIIEKDVKAYLDALDGAEGPFETALLDELRRLEPLDLEPAPVT
ncbi:MAG: NAD(P)-dependent oxidoreductase [Rhodospirillales bacterium]